MSEEQASGARSAGSNLSPGLEGVGVGRSPVVHAWPALNWRTLEDVAQTARQIPADGPGLHAQATCTPAVFAAAAGFLHEQGARLLALSASPADDGEVRLTYSFELGQSHIRLRAVTEKRVVDSLFALFSCADFLEREVDGLYGVKFLGHPNLLDREETHGRTDEAR